MALHLGKWLCAAVMVGGLAACDERKEETGQVTPDATDNVPDRATSNAAVAGAAPSSVVIPGPDAPK